jgi:hypothetical protein
MDRVSQLNKKFPASGTHTQNSHLLDSTLRQLNPDKILNAVFL